MAVYWLDPYIDANIGGIHGTLDTTTRNGTYSYPFGLRDFIGVNTTSTLSGGNKQSVLANGDELRIKGLANWTDFCIDLGSNWYYDGTWLRDNVGTENSDITSYLSSHPIAHGTRGLNWAFMYDPNDTDPFTQPGPYSSNGYCRKPCIVGMYYRGTTNQWRAIYGDNQNDAGTRYTILRSKAYNTSNTTKMYLISPEYIVPTQTTNDQNYYMFARSGSNYFTITDGWTSETVRDGVNIIQVVGGSQTIGYYIHQIHLCGQSTSGSTSYLDEHSAFLNTPNTHWVNSHYLPASSGYSYGVASWFLYGHRNSAGYTGSRYIIKPGSFTGSPYSNYPGVYNYVGYNYYSNSAGSNTTGVNSVDITYAENPYTHSIYGQHNHIIYRNMSVACRGESVPSGSYVRYFTIGSVFQRDNHSGSTNARIEFQAKPNSSAWIKMLANSHYLHAGGTYSKNQLLTGFVSDFVGPYIDSIGQGYDSGTGLPPYSSTYGSEGFGTLTQDREGAVIYNYSNESAGILSAYPNLTTYVDLPNLLNVITSNANSIKTNVDTTSTNWWATRGFQITDFENALNDGSNHLVLTLGNMITGDKSLSELTGAPILTGTLNTYNGAGRSQDITFSSSSKDNKTVHLMVPYNDDGGLSFAPIVYNDTSGNLVIQSNYRNDDIFIKTIPVPIASGHVSGSNLRGVVKYKFETVSGTGINSSSSFINWIFKHQNGNLASNAGSAFNTANTTETTINANWSSSLVAYDSFSPDHVFAEIRFYNYTGNDSADCGRLIITDLYTETY